MSVPWLLLPTMLVNFGERVGDGVAAGFVAENMPKGSVRRQNVHCARTDHRPDGAGQAEA